MYAGHNALGTTWAAIMLMLPNELGANVLNCS